MADINFNVVTTGLEKTANKSTDIVTDQASNTKYPSVKSVYDWAIGVFQSILSAVNFGSFLNGLSSKSSLVSADKISIVDSAGNEAKTISYSDFKDSIVGGTQSKNFVYAGPIIGANAAPTFRGLTNFDFPLENKVKVPLAGMVNAYGDSFTFGAGAAGSNYVSKLGAANNVVINNYGFGGIGAWYSCRMLFDNSLAYLGTSVWLSGLNDLRRGGSAPATILKIKGCLRSAIAMHFMDVVAYSPASTVTNTGSWSNITGMGGAPEMLSSGSARQSSTVGNTLTFTSIPSTTIVVGTFNTDGTTYDYGRFTVTIDGTLMTTFNPNGRADLLLDNFSYDNGRTQEALVFSGLNFTSHTVVVTLLDAKTTVVDYFGCLLDAGRASSMLVGSIPHLTSTGYAISPSNGSDAVFDAADVAIQEVIGEFPNMPVVYCPMNNYYFPYIHTQADNIHPNHEGYTAIANAFQAAIRPAGYKTIKLPSLGGPTYSSMRVYTNGNNARITANRDEGGVSDVTDAAQLQVNMTTTSGASTFSVSTSNVNNTAPTTSFLVTQTGDVEIPRSATTVKLGPSATNSAYYGVNGDIAIMAINRNMVGAAANASKSNASIFLRGVANAGTIEFYTSTLNNGSTSMAANFNANGRLFIGGNTSASGLLHLGAGTASPNTAPLKINAGIVNITAENGAIETDANNDLFQTNLSTVRGKVDVVRPLSSAAGTLTLSYQYTLYSFTGTTTTWTLPALAPGGNIVPVGHIFRIKNKGSGAITLNTSAAGNDIYDTAAVNTLSISSGESLMLIHDGTHFSKH